jgi:hypothetical protein
LPHAMSGGEQTSHLVTVDNSRFLIETSITTKNHALAGS